MALFVAVGVESAVLKSLPCWLLLTLETVHSFGRRVSRSGTQTIAVTGGSDAVGDGEVVAVRTVVLNGPCAISRSRSCWQQSRHQAQPRRFRP